MLIWFTNTSIIIITFLPVEEMFKFDPPDIVMEPEVEEFPQLFTAINITCGVFGTPQPNISWYKDGVLLPLQESQTLLIREVTLEDRGIYRCVAENFDPNTGQVKKFRDISSDTVLNIKGGGSIVYRLHG